MTPPLPAPSPAVLCANGGAKLWGGGGGTQARGDGGVLACTWHVAHTGTQHCSTAAALHLHGSILIPPPPTPPPCALCQWGCKAGGGLHARRGGGGGGPGMHTAHTRTQHCSTAAALHMHGCIPMSPPPLPQPCAPPGGAAVHSAPQCAHPTHPHTPIVQ